MIEQEINTEMDVNQEATHEESQEVENQEQPNQNQNVTDKENNFARLRQKSEQLQKERDEALAYAQQLQKKYSKQHEAAPEENYHINPDDLVEGKHLSKYDRELAQLKEQLKNYEQQTQEMVLEAKLKAQYNDFDAVVNKDNVDQLREIDPDVVDAISALPDLHKKAVLAYKMIKKYNIGAPDIYEKDRVRAQTNALKPKPLASISAQQGDTPLSHANAFAEGLTDELKAQLWNDMRKARQNI